HFLLTHLLLETMKKTSHESNVEGRIVNVSSEGHRFAYKEGIRFAKLNDEEEYSTIAAYGQSKLANILHANELARRFKVCLVPFRLCGCGTAPRLGFVLFRAC
uniref:Uncharacterized protein n=1 Tax=Aegilops tauschii subsp. strangulata TaxID=200361 RepID=A0A453GZA1_AEGTS